MNTFLKFATRFLYLYERNGWTFVSRNKVASDEAPTKANATAMCGIFVDSEGVKRIVVLKEYRKPLLGFEITLPAGLVDEGEDVNTTAIREFQEETGLNFAPQFTSPIKLASSAGLTDELCPIVFGTASGTVSLNPGIDGENIQVILPNREELKALLELPDCYYSARSWGVLYALAHNGKFGNLSL